MQAAKKKHFFKLFFLLFTTVIPKLIFSIDFGVGIDKGLCVKTEWNSSMSTSFSLNCDFYSVHDDNVDKWYDIQVYDITLVPMLYDVKLFDWLDIGVSLDYKTTLRNSELLNYTKKTHSIYFSAPSFEFKLNSIFSVYLQLSQQILVWYYTDQNCPDGYKFTFGNLDMNSINFGAIIFFR